MDTEKPDQKHYDVCLASMPYPVIDQPSVALGILKSALAEIGISGKTFYPCLSFAEEIGLDVFSFIADSKQEFLIGEWTFAGAAFPDFEADNETYLESVLSASVSHGLMRRSGFRDSPRAALWSARNRAPEFVDKVARELLAHRPKIVGCTSTFFQHCASLALLRRIKELAPEVVTFLGGANCEGQMGVTTKKCFSWVDYVVSGEGDVNFPEMCDRIINNRGSLEQRDLPEGVIGSGYFRQLQTDAPRSSVFSMDSVPQPDYGDYFDTLTCSSISEYVYPGLAIETSRGCWWGAKKHCTFCGLNGGNMAFRSKSPERVLGELEHLSSTHGIRKFNVVDNILDMKYTKNLLPQLAAGDPYVLFYETKSNLKREHLEIIAAAGIRRLQPGIESMHDEVLKLINKGTSAMQNVQLLKWARELGVFITWNLLWDVPGENDDWYEEMAAWIPKIAHLQPPGVDRIQFHRFSPYHFRAEEYELHLKPFQSYKSVYPLSDQEVNELAYYFQDTNRQSAEKELELRPHLKSLLRVVGIWNLLWGKMGAQQREEKPILSMNVTENDSGECIEIYDSRPCAVSKTLELSGLDALVFRTCNDTSQTYQGILKQLAGESSADPTSVMCSIEKLQGLNLLLELSGRYLGLALRESQRIPDTNEEFPGGYTDVEAWLSQKESESVNPTLSNV